MGTTIGSSPLGSVSSLNTGTDDVSAVTALALEGSKYLDQDGSKVYAVATGTDTYALTLSPAPTAYAAGNAYAVRFTNANTTAATINVNALGAKSIVKGSATALVAGDIPAGQVCVLVYDGTNFSLEHIETNAFHDNVAGEITALTEKTSIVAADLLVIEDSAASNVKKKVQISTLLETEAVAYTANHTITTAEQGFLFTNEGATAQIEFTLPSASLGLGPYMFINQDSDGLMVIAGTEDTIQIAPGAASATAGNAVPATTGCSLTLVAINATEWIALYATGTWTVT